MMKTPRFCAKGLAWPLACRIAIPCRAFKTSAPLDEKLSSNADTSSSFKLGKLSHVAIATANIDKSISFYRDVLKARVGDKHVLQEHGVTTAFVELPHTPIELLEPLGQDSPIQKFLDKNKKSGIHHLCIRVDDINAAISHFGTTGTRTLGNIKIGAHGLPVVFLHPKDTDDVLIELEESPKDK